MKKKLRGFYGTSIEGLERIVNTYAETNKQNIVHISTTQSTEGIYTIWVLFEEQHFE